MELKNNELVCIVGGSITTSMINAVTKMATTILKIGQTIGSVLRRYITNSYCVG